MVQNARAAALKHCAARQEIKKDEAVIAAGTMRIGVCAASCGRRENTAMVIFVKATQHALCHGRLFFQDNFSIGTCLGRRVPVSSDYPRRNGAGRRGYCLAVHHSPIVL